VKVLVDVDGSVRITVPVWVFVRSKVGEIVDVVNAAGEREGSGETVWVSVGKRKGRWVSVSVDAGIGDGGMLGICVFLFNDGKFVGVLDDKSGTEVAAAMYVYLPKGSTQDDKDMLITARRKHLNFINFNSSKYSSKQVELIGHPLFTEMQASIIDVCKGRIPNAKNPFHLVHLRDFSNNSNSCMDEK